MIHLRPIAAADAAALFPLVYLTRVLDTLLWDGPESLENYRQGLAEREQQVQSGASHIFSIVEDHSGQPVGTLSVRPNPSQVRGDLGLWIGEPYHGRGYGTQAVGLALVYGFERLGMRKIEAEVFVGNWASRRIFEKNGFQLEGLIRQSVLKRGVAVDEWVFGIIHAEYLRFQAQQAAGAAQPPAGWGRLPPRSGLLVHLCAQAAWESAQEAGAYRAPSLESEGFIHFSHPWQVLPVANRFYPGQAGLLLLWLDPRRLRAELRWESADEGYFPHLYGPLNLDAVVEVTPFHPDADGVFRNLPG